MEVEEHLARLSESHDFETKGGGDLQVSKRRPLKRASENKHLSKKGFSVELLAAYKVACEFLKNDKTWKNDWGIGPSTANKNEKKLITLGGMYPIVSSCLVLW